MVLGLTVEIRGDTKDLDSALSSSKGAVGGIGGELGGGVLKMAAFASVAGTAAIALAGMAKGAAEDQAEQVKLAKAIEGATGSTADHTAEVDKAIAAGQDLAFTDSQTRDALASLVTSTGDLTSATALLGTAQDVARFAGVDLATAADAVAKAQAGQDGALTKMLPGLEKGATATDTLANAQALAAGQAEAYSKTTEAGLAKTSDAMGELGETVGAALFPALDAIIPALIPIIRQLGTLIEAIIPVLIPLVKILSVVFGVWAKALGVVIGALITLVNWLGTVIKWIGDLLNKVGPLRDLGNLVGGIVGGISGSAAAAPALNATATSSGAGGSSAAVVINVTSTGDSLATERAITNALRRTMRLNAGAPGWSTG